MEIKTKQQGIKVVADVLDIVGGKWRGQILAHLCDAPKRFNELKTVLNRITSSTLTKELRYLEDIKMVERKIIQETPMVIEWEKINQKPMQRVLHGLSRFIPSVSSPFSQQLNPFFQQLNGSGIFQKRIKALALQCI